MLMTLFGVLAMIALALSLPTRDWRLKSVALTYFGVWSVTFLLSRSGITELPWVDSAYTAFIFLLAFSVQARGEVERKRGEPLAMWLLVPMGVETIIGLSHLFQPLLSSLTHWRLMQAGFAIELICLIVVGGRRLDLVGRVRRGVKALVSSTRTAPRPA